MTTWRVARETADYWVGGITVTDAGTPVDPTDLAFAVLPSGERPAVSDWATPVDNPDGAGVGVVVGAVTAPARYGIFAQITKGSATLVLEPDQVGWITRT